MGSRAHFPTELPHPEAAELELLSATDALAVFDRADRAVLESVAGARAEIAAAVELVAERLGTGGRLIYVGAGTSGRLGVLDAVECPPTFRSAPDQVQGRIAGGPDALLASVEGAEDSREAGAHDVDDVGPRDVVFGIAAGGTTPYVHAALARARELGAATVFLACVPRELAPDEADVSIRLATGPELVAGSTRLKAGTATKLVLNRVTTLAMARLGKVHAGLMVDVDTGANAKLVDRGIALVRRITGIEAAEAAALLERAEGGVKTACVMWRHGCEPDEARSRLVAAGGVLRSALD